MILIDCCESLAKTTSNWKRHILSQEQSVDEVTQQPHVIVVVDVFVLLGVAIDPGFNHPVHSTCGFQSHLVDGYAGPTAVEMQPVLFQVDESLVFHLPGDEAQAEAFVLL